MKERLKRLYNEKRLTLQGVANAVEQGLITVEDFKEITGKNYDSI